MALALALALALPGGALAQGDDYLAGESSGADEPEPTIPRAYPVDRYLGVWLKSPFQLEAAGEVTVTPQSFARDYSLTGIIQDGEEAIVYIQNDKTGEVIRLTSDESAEGFQLLSANPSPDPNAASVQVKHGNETATLKYADSTFGKTASPAAGTPPMTAPGGGAPARPTPGQPVVGLAMPMRQNANDAANAGNNPSAAGADLNPAQMRLQQLREQQLKQQAAQQENPDNTAGRSPASRRRVILPSQAD